MINIAIISCFIMLLGSHLVISQLIDFTEKDWPSTCKLGIRNSPIDFPALSTGNYILSNNYLQILSSNYTILSNTKWAFSTTKKSFYVDITNLPGTLMIKKNGINYAYNLLDIHFHSLSEHTFDGVTTDLEIHLVHKKNNDYLISQGVLDDPDAQNYYLVVALRWKGSGDTKSSEIADFNFNTTLNINNVELNKYIKEVKNFYHYLGGLTTPNCDEVVNWIVIDNVYNMSTAQSKIIYDWVRSYYPIGNSRNPVARNNRTIYYITNTRNSNSVSNDDWKIAVSVLVPSLVISIIFLIIICCLRKNKEEIVKDTARHQKISNVETVENIHK